MLEPMLERSGARLGGGLTHPALQIFTRQTTSAPPRSLPVPAANQLTLFSWGDYLEQTFHGEEDCVLGALGLDFESRLPNMHGEMQLQKRSHESKIVSNWRSQIKISCTPLRTATLFAFPTLGPRVPNMTRVGRSFPDKRY